MRLMRTVCAIIIVLVIVSLDHVHAQDRQPNIVFIFIDDMGYADPSCFGNPVVETPNIDRLAEEGIRLTNFYVNSPICSPSRVAVTTGQYSGRWKIHSYLNTRAGNARLGMRDFLSASAPTTAKKLKAAGYATAHFGKWHMGGGRDVDDAPLPSAYGFDESWVAFEGLGDRLLTNPKNSSVKLGHGKIEFCHRSEKTKKYTDRAIDFIRRHKDKPFYVRLFPNDVHDPHVPPEGNDKKWAEKTKNHYEQKFFAVLEEMDRQIGRLVDVVDELKLAEKTLIVFTSDNGPTDWPKYYDEVDNPPGFTGPFFGRKWSLYEGGIRMPFIARWKGKIPAGEMDEESVMSAIDLSPTFCKLAGVAIPNAEKLDGVERSAVWLGTPSARSKPIFWQYGAPHAVLKPGKAEYHSPSFAVRDGDWKLLIDPDGSEAQLFNLVKDPGEKNNLLEKQPERVKVLLEQLRIWAADIPYEFESNAKPIAPRPVVTARFNNQIFRFQNHGVETSNASWKFDGKSWLELPRRNIPQHGGDRAMRLAVTIDADADDGVIIAHGGDRWGYSLYLSDGKPVFATCVDWKRTLVEGSSRLEDGRHELHIQWGKDGSMFLKVDGRLAARGKAPGVLRQTPGDTMQIGADLIKPVGNYEVPNAFQGTISGLSGWYAR